MSLRWAALGAAIIASGCVPAEEMERREQRRLERAATQFEMQDWEAEYDSCLFEAKGYFGSADAETVRHCEERATERTKP